MSQILRSKRILTLEGIRPADIVIEGNVVEAVLDYGTVSGAYDLQDLLVVPGFVDLHSDAIEKEIEPRPGAAFPVKTALVNLDKKLAMSGITTMFHAIAFNEEALVGQRGTEMAANIIKTLGECEESLLSIDNLVHARYEITSFSSVDRILELMEKRLVQMLSLMDHSPGQGQFKSLEKWKEYHVPVYDLSSMEADRIVAQQKEKKERCVERLEQLTKKAKELGILIASHDDDCKDKIDFMERLGITIAEFPLNVETAIYASSREMATGMGAPNVVRGKSQSGNISARELLKFGCCDFLCSDYHPTSMLQAVYKMHRELGLDLAHAFSFITSTPARVSGLHDRGRIEKGCLADIIVIDDTLVPQVVMTLKNGREIYNTGTRFPIYEHA